MQSQNLPDRTNDSFGRALEDLIENQNLSKEQKQIEIIQLIEIIQSNNGNLNSVDEKGRSFLVNALDQRLDEIAKILLALQKDNDVIFSVDRDGRTALHAALNHQFISLWLMYIALQKKRMNDFLVQDTFGNTVLHAPLIHHNDLIIERLLSIFYLKMKDSSLSAFNEFINAVNKNGETALHSAFRLNRVQTIRSLIKHGADLSLIDDTGVTPILFFAILPVEEQFFIFLSLSQDRKKALLLAYRDLLIKYNNNELFKNLTNDNYKQFLQDNNMLGDLRENYFKLTIRFKLKTYLFALHEFDERIPLRKTYLRKIVNTNEIIITPNMPWTVKILGQMPLYAKKLGAITKSEYDLENDDDILTNLIDIMDNLVKKLQGRTVYFAANKALAVLIPIIWIVGFVGAVIWSLNKFSSIETEADTLRKDALSKGEDYDRISYDSLKNSAVPYISGGLFLMVIGGVVTFVIIPTMIKLWRRESTVSSDEWQPIIDQLQGILMRLKAQESQNSLSPKMKNNLNELEAGIIELETRESGFLSNFPTPRKPTSRVTTILTRLQGIVENIHSLVNQEQKSLVLKRLPSSIGLFKPKQASPYRVLPEEGYLTFPEENNQNFSSDDSSSFDSAKDRDSDDEKLFRGYKGSLFGSKNFVRYYDSSDDDEPLLPVVYRKELSKQESEASLLGKDWEEEATQKQSNFKNRY